MIIACLNIFEGIDCEDSSITLIVKLAWNSKTIAIYPICETGMTYFFSWCIELMFNWEIISVEEGNQSIEVDKQNILTIFHQLKDLGTSDLLVE